LAFKPRRMVQGLAWGGAFLLASALVSGCSPAQYTYVSDSGNSTYFKVPHYWGQVSSTDLCHQLESYSQTSTCPAYWTTAYEGQRPAAASGFLDFDLNKPFIYAQVTPYQSTSATALTDQTLEDAFLPVSESSRETEAEEGFPLTDFKSLLDEPVSLNGGYHGVREVFDYTEAGAPANTFDEVVLTNGNNSDIYMLLLHCTASCYAQDKTTINDVMSSFTVRSN
jgi:hypothetical protein